MCICSFVVTSKSKLPIMLLTPCLVCCNVQASVAGVTSDERFWLQLHFLCSLLAPFAEAMARVQSRAASLADIVVHVLQLDRLLEAAKTVSVVPAGKPCLCSSPLTAEVHTPTMEVCFLAILSLQVCSRFKGFMHNSRTLADQHYCAYEMLFEQPCRAVLSQHSCPCWEWMAADFVARCLEVYQQRTAELDGELCRLALLLQPQYKLIAVLTPSLVQKVLTPAHPVCHHPCRPGLVLPCQGACIIWG